MSTLNQQMRLADGRRLGYDEYGPSDGVPLFYFHGTPSSRVEFQLFANEEMLQCKRRSFIPVQEKFRRNLPFFGGLASGKHQKNLR